MLQLGLTFKKKLLDFGAKNLSKSHLKSIKKRHRIQRRFRNRFFIEAPFSTILGSILDHLGFQNQSKIDLKSSLAFFLLPSRLPNAFQTVSGTFWDHFGSIWVRFWHPFMSIFDNF
jgi:hypothetical protein